MMKTIIAFLNRNPWIYVVLAFAILIGAWAAIITLAVKHSPEEIEVKKEAVEIQIK
jgi:multidrug efflux pump subunit AcrB